MFGYIFICCVAAIIPAFLITYRISDVYTKYRSPEKRQEAVELARKEGRYATAKLISEGARDPDTDKCLCKYEYKYKGKIYHFNMSFTETPSNRYAPCEVDVFFRKSPKKARVYNQYGKMETEQKYVFLFLWIFIAILFFVLLNQRLQKAGII